MATIKLRVGAPANLTAGEVDANFTSLKQEVEAATSALTLKQAKFDVRQNGTSVSFGSEATALNFTGATVTYNSGAYTVAIPIGSATWGSISGTLANQTDLQTALSTATSAANSANSAALAAQSTANAAQTAATSATTALGLKSDKISFQNNGTATPNSSTYPTTFNVVGATWSIAGGVATLTVPTTSAVTNLGYTPSATNGVVTSSAGTSATLPLATGTNAGLLQPSDFTQLAGLTAALAGKQATLVSATNIKTVNGASLLGSGDLTIAGGSGGETTLFRSFNATGGTGVIVVNLTASATTSTNLNAITAVASVGSGADQNSIIVTLSNVPADVRLKNAMVSFDAASLPAPNVGFSLRYPEPFGRTSQDNCVSPVVAAIYNDLFVSQATTSVNYRFISGSTIQLQKMGLVSGTGYKMVMKLQG